MELLGDAVDRAVAAGPRLADRFAGLRAVDAIGMGFSEGSAGYAALLVREATRVPSAWFDTRQYLHGPVEAAEPGVGAVVFGDGREVDLARDLVAYGATVLLVTAEEVGPAERLEVFRVPEIAGPVRAILEAVPAQVLAGAVAGAQGLSPGEFRREQADAKLEAAG